MLTKFIHLKFSVYTEFIRHFSLLSVKKENILTYFSSSYRILLIALFTLLFLPHVFVVVNDDINFILAYEVDPGSIIDSILSLYQHSYNMNAAYHSQYYGWTYYSISYLLLMPIYLAKELKFITDDYFFFIGLRFVFFMIGLSSLLSYFEVAKRILKHAFLSFVAALLFIASPTVHHYFYTLHPESTGMLFLFLGILSLLNFNDEQAKNYRWYTFGLLSLVLSTLSKHVFFLTALPVLFLFYYLYCHYHDVPILKFAFSKLFAKILGASTLFSMLVFFIINPFAFIQPKIFITNQKFMFSTHSQGAISDIEIHALKQWIEIIKEVPIIYISVIIVPFTLLGAIIFWHKQRVGTIFYITNIIGAILYIIIISISASYITQLGYLAPVYPFFILNLMSIPLYILKKWNRRAIKWITIIPLAYFLFFLLVSDFSVTLPAAYSRLMYQDSLVFKVYNYIGMNIPYGSRIAHDHHVAIPSNKEAIACIFWEGCGYDIEEFQPDYVIFDENWVFGGELYSGTIRLRDHISDHNFILIEKINSVSVWKKPNQ